MTSILLEGFEAINLNTEDPEERFITNGVSWQQYEELLLNLGDCN